MKVFMGEKRTICYENCRCPHCKHDLTTTASTTPHCPLCNKALDSHDVWMTRTYPGPTELPGWLRAFGWPFFLMLAGFGLFLLRRYGGAPLPLSLAWVPLAIGFVYFMVKLMTDGEDI
jgi:hypothetical protein